jgi:OOP family OmpA-OmpF porin
MKNLIMVIFSLFFLLTGPGLSTAAAQDIKGSKDHPMLSRMPDFRISDYKDAEFDSYRFIGADKKAVAIEGHKYYIEYRLNSGVSEHGELKIRKNVRMLLSIP